MEQELSRSDAVVRLERSVLGCDYGGSSWTTREEAGRVAERLELERGMRLLEVGAGSGWPGLYLAGLTGCDVVLSDVPVVGLQMALRRAREDSLTERCSAVAADAAALPFPAASFDAISHSDVLCCMPAKEAMLTACRRVARSGARMVFSVIAPNHVLTDSERRLAVASGPPHVEVDSDYGDLLDRLGWNVIERNDVTVEYRRSVQSMLTGMDNDQEALVQALGKEEFKRRIERRRNALTAIGDGLLRREIFVTRAR
jgi:SAM-dependent methyltransferase